MLLEDKRVIILGSEVTAGKKAEKDLGVLVMFKV